MGYKLPPGDVEWRIHGKKKPFAYSTKATSDIIDVLYEQYITTDEVLKHINFDMEARKIVEMIKEREKNG